MISRTSDAAVAERKAIVAIRGLYPSFGAHKLAQKIQTRDFPINTDAYVLSGKCTSRTLYSTLSVIRRHDATQKKLAKVAA